MNVQSLFRLLLSFVITAGIASPAVAAPLTPGNPVILRAGDGSAAISNAATAVFPDEFTTAGAPVQTITIPATGATQALTISGSATSEGMLSRSQDGKMLLFGGYRKDAGGTNPVADTPATTSRVIGRLLADGTFDTTVTLTDVIGNMRSATTVSGGSFYIGASSGVRYMADPLLTTSVQIDNRNSRQVALSANTLFACNGSTSAGFTAKVQSYGSLPTGATAAIPIVNLAMADAVNSMWLFDVNPAVAGDDTLYIASVVENQVRKYTYDGITWNDGGNLPGQGIFHITGSVSGNTVNLFCTSATTLYSLTDTSGSGTLNGTLTVLATAGTNTIFKGVALFPPAAAAPLNLLSFSLTPLGGGGQQVALSVQGSPGISARLELTNDLASWSTVQTVPLDASGLGTFNYADTTAGGRRYYRAAAP